MTEPAANGQTQAAEPARTGNYFRETRPAEPDEPRVLYRVEEHIAHVVINRPLVLNAIHADVHHGIVDGMRQADAIRKLGGNPEHIADARRAPGSFHCYLELHIEQGGTLDKAGVAIGVVEGIVAIDRYDVEIHGFANHAGTTPMPDRRDALLAASHLTIAVNEVVRREPGRQVGTVGQLSVTPNAPNVVPGLVQMTIELRDLSAEKIAGLAGQIRTRAKAIAAQTGTEIAIRPAAHHDSALASPEIQKSIEAACARLGLQSKRLPSGAGHDAQMMAKLGPMGMIFVPSVEGISHAPKELSRWEDCANGANVLLETVLERAG